MIIDFRRAAKALVRGIQLRCPWCGYGPMFRGWFSMAASCPACGLRFEREQGYFVGAIYLNFAATVLIAIPGYLALYAAGLSLGLQLVVVGALCLIFPLWFFRYSKSLWMAMDYFFDPAERSRQVSPHYASGLGRRSDATERDEPARVECYAGSRGEERPRRLWRRGRWEEVTVLERWVGESVEGASRTRWFRVRLEQGTEGLLSHDEELDAWFWRAGDLGASP